MLYLAYLFSNVDLFEIISKIPVAISGVKLLYISKIPVAISGVKLL